MAKYPGTPVPLHIDSSNFPLKLNKEEQNIFGNQKLSRGQVAEIQAALNKNTNNSNEVVAFLPKRDPSNFRIFYDVHVVDSLPVLQTSQGFTAFSKGRITNTNPSPPAIDSAN
jgi:hypothetical protein